MNQYARRKARALAVQALYQWHYTTASITDLENRHLATANPKKVDLDYFANLVRGVVKNCAEIDAAFIPFLDRKITELNPVELTVLRIAAYELLFRLDVPYKVVINEALELAKIFGSVEGHKYVNGVLDKMAKLKRPEAK